MRLHRSRFLPAALAVGALLGSVAVAEDEPAGGGIAWVDGFQAGAAAAKEADRLLFVYVGRHNPT